MFIKFLYDRFKVKGSLDTFYGSRNRITGKEWFSVYRGGRRTDHWSKFGSRKSFLSNIKPTEIR